jgi:tetratricopeptide (TPR) repeat protein
MLASSLKAVIAQTLCKRADAKGRVAAMEILVVTTGIASNIRDGKTHQIPSAMQVGRALGMKLFDEALYDLLKSGTISIEEAHSRAMDKDTFAKKVATLGVRVDAHGQAGDAGDGADQLAKRQDVINRYLDTLQKEPDNVDVLNNLAWLLATADNPDPGMIDRALVMIEKANEITKGQHPGVLDTLGAVHAQSGRFDQALDAARKGLELAQASQQTALVAALERRIELYELGKPMRD